MKIIVTSVGTRGDMEPFLAIGEMMKEKGHQVICLFPEQFRNLADNTGLEFASLGKEFIEMLDSPEGRIAMGGGPFGLKKLMAYIKLIKRQGNINKAMVQKQHDVIEKEQPDRVVHNGKAIYPVIWSLQNKGKTALVSPVPYLHYVKDHAHVAFNRNFGPWLNKLTYQLANYGLVKTIMGTIKWIDKTKKIKQKQVQKALFENNTIYTISPSLFKRPYYWPENRKVLGYHERNKTNNWQPEDTLLQFVKKNQKLVLVTFGSMINNNPAEKTRIILKVLEKMNIPAIINTASGGLVKPASYNPERFYFVDSIPYDWAFQKMYAVIHHGGSGTTHTGLKHGCATLTIPHIIDQYVWNKLVHKSGAGPLGVDVSKIAEKNFTEMVTNLMNDDNYKVNARKLAEKMRQEDFKEEMHKTITE